MEFTDEELAEFQDEAQELLEQAESSMLDIENGGDVKANYQAIFRSFHSLKGAAGMLGLDILRTHMHHLENHFQSYSGKTEMPKKASTYFLSGIDGARKILENENIIFDYTFPDMGDSNLSSTPIASVASAAAASSSNTKNSTPSTSNTNSDKPASGLHIVKKEAPLIYICDDEPDIVSLLTFTITKAGFRAKGFTQAQQAIDNLLTDKPYAIFTDMSMPEMSGLDLLKKAHELEPNIPVIFVSAHLSTDIMINALEHGVFGAIEKPFTSEQVKTMAKNAVKKYETWLLLNRSIDFALFQFSDLDEYLQKSGKNDLRMTMKQEIDNILGARRELRKLGTR